ncbi:MAG TPA: MFS transporter [Steroidobacteraceae bacterium]|nr:MFS transporter [Steroidobacteraceae bacterium]
MLIDISPLKRHRDFRLLFVGQLISFLGSMVSYMAVPYQVYQLTKSNAWVGALGIAQLVPVLLFGLLGGAYADRINRRLLMLSSESGMAVVIALLLLNSLLPTPSLAAIFILAALLQAIAAFHSPAMEALTQKLVEPSEYAAAGALSGFRGSAGAIAGPLLGGVLIAAFGLTGAYLFDLLSFAGAVICIALMRQTANPEVQSHSPLTDAAIGVRFALSRAELIGTYLIDIAAMLFAFPVALFPALSLQWGDARMTGVLFSSMAIGSLIATLLSGWSSRIRRQGRVVVIAAAGWGLFILGAGLAPTPWLVVLCLVVAGGADMISGLFRGIIWNHSVPNAMRGRLAGIAMISYMTGPLLGNARAGWVASLSSVPFSMWSGGLACMIAVVATSLALPKFWAYRSHLEASAAPSPGEATT